MKKALFVVVSLSLMLSLSAFAGEHKKCTKPVQDCLNSMVVKLKSSGFIGVELDKGKGGVLKITKVVEGSPAEKAGIKQGDELFAINGIRFNDENHKKISKVKLPGKRVSCTIKRDGASREVKLTLSPMPADLMSKYIGEHMLSHAKQGESVAKADK